MTIGRFVWLLTLAIIGVAAESFTVRASAFVTIMLYGEGL